VTSRPGDELTCDELTVWRVDRVTSWLSPYWPIRSGSELARERKGSVPYLLLSIVVNKTS